MKKELIIGSSITGMVIGIGGYMVGKQQKMKKRNITSVFYSKKSALIVTSVASMVDQFIMPSIKLLLSMGYVVDVATNFKYGSTCSDEKIQKLIEVLDGMAVDCYHIDFDRKVLDIKADICAFKQVDKVVKGIAKPLNHTKHRSINSLKDNGYTLIHSHSPIGGMVGRVIAHKYHIFSIYTAHGFHFYKGAPLKNWLIFFPIEDWLSRYTNILITINTEDYERAQKKMHAKKTVYTPGIGVDTEKFRSVKINREKKRAELGLTNDDIMLLSVGELNINKNHKIVIEAIGMMNENERISIHYFIAGKGELHDEYIKLADKLGVNLHLLGFRNDIPELLKAADTFLLPSIREGLNVGLMEAMASGLPCVVSDIRGNRDLIISNEGGYRASPSNSRKWMIEIRHIVYDECGKLLYGENNRKKIKKFEVNVVIEILTQIYQI